MAAAGILSVWSIFLDTLCAEDDLGTLPRIAEVLTHCATSLGNFEFGVPIQRQVLFQVAIVLQRELDSRSGDDLARLRNPLNSHNSYCARAVKGYELLQCFSLVTNPLRESRFNAIRALLFFRILEDDFNRTKLKQIANGLRKSSSRHEHAWGKLIDALPDPDTTTGSWIDALTKVIVLLKPNAKSDAERNFLGAFTWLCDEEQLIAMTISDHSLRDECETQAGAHAKNKIREFYEPAVRFSPDERKPRKFSAFVAPPEESGEEPLAPEPARIDVEITPETPAQEPEISTSISAFSAKRSGYRLAEMSHMLRWDWNHLNFHDLNLLVSAAANELNEESPGRHAALFALLVLTTGIDAQDLPAIPLGSNMTEVEHLTVEGKWIKPILMPKEAWKPSQECRAIFMDSAKTLEFQLPSLVRHGLTLLFKEHPHAKTIGQLTKCHETSGVEFMGRWLDPLRLSAGNARLTHGRLARALRVEVNALSHNAVSSHFIAGRDFDVPPVATYYSGISLNSLAMLYEAACAQLLNQPTNTLASTKQPDLFVGSAVLPNKDEICQFVTSLIHTLEGVSEADIVRLHNTFVTYTLWMLLLGTGHRPVMDPIESIDILDLDRGWLIVNDKQSTPTKAGRLVPLGKILTAQLRHYLTHLARLKNHLKASNPELALRIESALTPAGPRCIPLFFYLDEDNRNWKPINRAALLISLNNLQGLPLNLGRHLLATVATEENWSCEAIREMLGHIEYGTAAFSSTSPLSPNALRDLDDKVDLYLLDMGWKPIPTVLSELKEPDDSTDAPSKLAPIRLGSSSRLETHVRQANNCRTAVNALMRSILIGKPLKQLTQADVDQIFQAALDGKSEPRSLASLERYNKVMRRFRFLKDRYSLKIALPRKFSELPLEKAAFEQDALQCTRMHAAICRGFQELAFKRARSSSKITETAQFAEAICSLVIHSYILDQSLLLGFFENGTIKLLDAPVGMFVEFCMGSDETDTSIRRHALHPISAVLLARSVPNLPDLLGKEKAIQKEIRLLIQACLPDDSGSVVEQFMIPASALSWLIEQTIPVARFELPGNVRAFQEGLFQSFALPREDFVRLLHGRPLKLLSVQCATNATDTSVEDLEEGTLASPEKSSEESSNNASRANAIVLHRAVCRSITGIVRHRGEGMDDNRDNLIRSNRQKDVLESEARSLLKNHASAPQIAVLLVRWLIHLCKNGVNGKSLKASSCANYYQTLARSLIDLGANLELTQLSTDALGETYSDCISAANSSHQEYMLSRLQEFHRFLMRSEGIARVDWAEIAPEGVGGTANIDAGFITWDEYVATFELLLNDPYADTRVQHLQALSWFFMYRFGARRNEAFGLRRKDVIFGDDGLVLLFRHNDFREIKSDNGIRQVPLIGPLLPQERLALTRWLAHIEEFAAEDQLSAVFSTPGHGRRLMDRRKIGERITEALKATTCSPRMRLHYARHSFATRNEWLMSTNLENFNEKWQPIIRRLIGPIDPREARQLLTDTPNISKKGLWASTAAVGHGWPGMTARHYVHGTDLLATALLEQLWEKEKEKVALDPATIAYLAGTSVSEIVATCGGGRIKIGLQNSHVRKIVSSQFEKSHADLYPRVPKPELGPLSLTGKNLTVGEVDKIISLIHLGRNVHAIEDLTFVPITVLNDLVEAACAVQDEAYYGVPGSSWSQFRETGDINFSRSGKRSPAETSRLKHFFQKLDSITSTSNVANNLLDQISALWTKRYRRTRSDLIISKPEELETLLQLMTATLIPPHLVEIRVGQDGYEIARIEAIATKLGFGGSKIVISRDLPMMGSKKPSDRKMRIGVIVLENSEGPLTSTAQLHRALFALAIYRRIPKISPSVT